MTGEEMTAALHALGDALEAEGTTGRIFLVGGAVMVLAFQTRESSDDLDAAVVPNEAVLRVARAVGRRRGLQPDWLSEAAAIFIPIAKEPDWQPTGTYGTLEVLRADEATMLAMKLRASRGLRDRGDIELLVQRCGLTTKDEVLALYEEYFPEDPLPARAGPLIRAALAKSEPTDGDRGPRDDGPSS